MSKGAHNFKQGDVTKAVKGVVNAGLEVQRVEWEPGKIVVFVGKGEVGNTASEAPPTMGSGSKSRWQISSWIM